MATLVDLKRMQTNDTRLKSLFLTFSSRLGMDEFRAAVQTNSVIEEIVISADESFVQECSEDSLLDIFEAMGRLPRLRKLSINSYPGCRGIVSVKSINSMLLHAQCLQIFTVSDVDMMATTEDFQTLANNLQSKFFLQTFGITGCSFILPSDNVRRSSLSQDIFKTPTATPITQALLDPVFTTLSMLPSLNVVVVEPRNQGCLGTISVSAATSICLSASIRMLRLRNLDLSDHHVSSMTMMLEQNRSLLSLELGTLVGLQPAAAAAIGKMMRTNATLVDVVLGLDAMIRDDCAQLLADALQRNNHVRSFSLRMSPATIHAASTGSKPKLERVSAKCRRAFLQMLQYNYTLEKFLLFRKAPLSKEQKLYAGLNKQGRGQLLLKHSADANNADDWVEKLAQVNDDLNAIFYFVSCNPTLCMTPSHQTCTTPLKRNQCPRNDDDAQLSEPPRKKRIVIG